MKKRVYLFLFLLPAFLILSGCGKKAVNNNISPAAQNPAAQNDVVANKATPETTKMSTSVRDMLKSGKSLECTFSFTNVEEGATQTGKMYVDGSKARFRSETEVTTNSTGQKIQAYMITAGDFGYSWGSADSKTGFKINLNEPTPAGSTDQAVQNTEDLDQLIDFDCRNWSVDNSKFDLPAGVIFTDFNEMLKSLSVPPATTNFNACSVCNSIPDAKFKADCQKANCK